MPTGVYTRTRPAWNKGRKMSPEWGVARRHSFLGKHHTEESKRKISEANKGHLTSAETREAVSNAQKGKTGEQARNWKGGRRISTYKYILVYCPDHPYKRKGKNNPYVFEHRYIMEQHLGRYLTPKERVHHINGDKKDNRIENLYLSESPSEHRKLHHSIEALVYELMGRGMIGFKNGQYFIK